MGIFKGIGNAEVGAKTRFLIGGRYVVFIERIFLKATRKKRNAFIMEERVILVLDDKNEAKPHTVGEAVSHYMDDGNESFLGNVKGVITELSEEIYGEEFQPDEMSDDDWEILAENVCGDAQPLSGFFFIVDCTMITTKANKPFTVIKYTQMLVPDQIKTMLESSETTKGDILKLWPDGELDAMIAAEAAA